MPVVIRSSKTIILCRQKAKRDPQISLVESKKDKGGGTWKKSLKVVLRRVR